MQSIYRQVSGLQRYRSVVYTEQLQNREQFPWDEVRVMTRQVRPRPRGNFLLRFWFKHIVRQWPPPYPINRLPEEPWYPYNLPQLLAADSPAVVHAYYGHKAVKYLEMIEAWGGPWVVSFHGVDVVKNTDDPDYVATLREVFAKARLVLARSMSLLQALEALGCPRHKLRLNRTPIPLEAFPVIRRDPPEDGRWRLIQACRLIGKKGLYTTLEALKTVVLHYPKIQWTLCGQGPEKERFLEACDAMGLSAHVRLIGWLDQAKLRAEYERSHIFIHPSELTAGSDQEGIPNSMLEAMATGLPLVATRHGGIPEAATDGVDSLLVAERSPGQLAGALLHLLGDAALYRRLSEGAAKTVRENFGAAACISRLEDAYDEALRPDPVVPRPEVKVPATSGHA